MKKSNVVHAAAAIVLLLAFIVAAQSSAEEWAPVKGKIMTRWAKEVSPDNALVEYPRPMMVRKEWMNLNGLWDYAVRARTEGRPMQYDGRILVPFPVESALSGVAKQVGDKNALWYQTKFKVPESWMKGRVLLHFGASDWETTVWVNNRLVGTHQGGYDPFTMDITDALNGTSGNLIVQVWDPIDAGYQPRGKQVAQPQGIWYTSVTGLWQTVWIEPVPRSYVDSLKVVTDIDNEKLLLDVYAGGGGCDDGCSITVSVKNGEKEFTGESNVKQGVASVTVKIPGAKLWTPDNPFLYSMNVKLKKSEVASDSIDSYFGMRKIEVSKDAEGALRLFLNNKPLFHYGTLDQGWWPDGLYTAPTDAALKYDIEILKKFGFNMLRKHVKVEPDRLYYWCDKLGLLVWQDMPSGDAYIHPNDADITRTGQSARNYEHELKAMIDSLRNHPSIVMWVPFNEGWGQFDTARIVEWIKGYDPTRLVDNTSGWADRGVGDVWDAHIYPGPGTPGSDGVRAPVLGEYGGLGLPIRGHTWQDEKNWGYRSYVNQKQLTEAYVGLTKNLKFLAWDGLGASVYTQTSDVEVEVNGLMSYDREIIKVDPSAAAAAAVELFKPYPKNYVILADARKANSMWKYRFAPPSGNWSSKDYDDSKWKSGEGGFGDGKTNKFPTGTTWSGDGIWLRRTFELKEGNYSDLQLSIGRMQDAKVYINGVLAADLKGNGNGYEYVPISEEALKTIKPGLNVLAVSARQTVGSHYIDAGLIHIGN